MSTLEEDREVLNAAREVLRRHGHGIGAACTGACQWGGRVPAAILQAEWDAEHAGQPYSLADR